ncbi:SDR family oxidoreductase [Microbacterium sp. LWH7-1.2]|uniref:SDR family NAD(P)-dependent oxidoreductase n=1 Tax=Microbacterium sp. LWH7-1.2 TaxID=3135257 RepID=UPI00313862BE
MADDVFSTGAFQGKRVLITGGGTGVGQATALAFAARGARVLVGGRRSQPLERTRELAAGLPGSIEGQQVDVLSAGSVRSMVDRATREWGGVDVLFNNAGNSGQGRPLAAVDEESFDRTIGIHAKGVFLGMKYAIPAMVESGGGAIINMSSIAGVVGMAGNAEYCAAMAAVIGLTKAAAVDYARHGVRVNAICPGAHRTEILNEFISRFTPDEWQEHVDRVYPTRRVADPSEAAAVVLFLASDAASNIHGVALPVDGGYLAL